MKKTPKTKLRLGREAVRALETHDLQQVQGGEVVRQTGDSKKVCCA